MRSPAIALSLTLASALSAAADAAAPAAAEPSAAETLRLEWSFLPGIEGVSVEQVDLHLQSLGAGGSTVWIGASAGSLGGGGGESDTAIGIGVSALHAWRSPGAIGCTTKAGPFFRWHRGDVDQVINAVPTAVGFATPSVPPTLGLFSGTIYLPSQHYHVKTDGYVAGGLEFACALTVDLDPVTLEAGPFFDLGLGQGTGNDILEFATGAIGNMAVYPKGVRGDLDAETGLYLATGFEVNALVGWQGFDVGAGLFWMKAEAQDQVDVTIDYEGIPIVGSNAALVTGMTTGSFDRRFGIDGLGAKLIVGCAF